MPSPSPSTATLLPSGIVLKKGCISAIPWHCSMISSSGVPRRRCREINRQASSVTPCWKLPPLPSQPKTSKGSPSSSVETVT